MTQCLKEGRGKKEIVPSGHTSSEQVTLVGGLNFPFMFCLNFYYENFQIYSKVYRVV